VRIDSVTRVLLIEDNPGDADLVRLACDEADPSVFEIEHTSTLRDALARVKSPPAPDVVLLDLTLPDAFGLDGLRRLADAAPELPVVVLTGSADRALGAAALQAGAQDYLLKGAADAALLPRALRYAIERHDHAVRARLLTGERAARAAAEAERERMSVLAAASLAVSHSLDDRHALSSLVAAVVPRFADWCATRIWVGEDDPSEWITAHRDASAAANVSAHLARVAAPDTGRGPGAVAASGCAELHEDVAAKAVRSPWRMALSELGVGSALVVPVRLTDEVFGVTVFAAGAARRFGPDDLATAEEIGRRAGVAVANCRLYREARLALAAREEFMAVAAHELRTPVAVLQLKLQHVELKQRESVCGTCHLAVPADYAGAARQIARLGTLIEGLLDVSRIVGERLKIQPENLDLCEVAREVIDRFADLAGRGRSDIVLVCAEPVRGSWDRLAMERVFGNLLSNAIKFGGEKPVEVRVSSEDSLAVIEVEDHGIGIAPEDVDRIFDRFERAVSWRHFGGLGLGLYITRRLVEEHGGRIAVTSKPAAGSLFTIRLPRAVVASGAA
jgi:signal transduction histidine kinase/DNA-binding NarL/FixJ family response regulator